MPDEAVGPVDGRTGLEKYVRIVVNNVLGREINRVHCHFLSNHGNDRLRTLKK